MADTDIIDEKSEFSDLLVSCRSHSPSQYLGFNKRMSYGSKGNSSLPKGSDDFDWITEIDSSFEKKSKNNDNIDKKEFDAVYREQKERELMMNTYIPMKTGNKLSPKSAAANEADEIEMNFLCLIIDSLSLNHSRFKNEIDEQFMTNLGSSQNITVSGITQLTKEFSENLPSLNAMKGESVVTGKKKAQDLWGGIFTSDETRNNLADTSTNSLPPQSDVKDAILTIIRQNIEENKKDKYDGINNGFLLRNVFLRAVCDAIKSRIVISDTIKFDLGYKSQFEICVPDLIALLLEMTHPSVQKTV